MVDSGRSLVLGFIGHETVHRDNTRALLADLIAAYLRNNKGAQVTFILSANPFTDTMVDLADYCLTSGYKLGLIGHEDDFDGPAIDPYVADAVGNLHKIKPDQSIPVVMAATLKMWSNAQSSARMILIGDPNDDDAAYVALEASTEKSIPVRSLLKGLDIVQLKSDEEETPPMPVVPDDDLEEEDEYVDDELEDEEFEDEEEPEPEDEDLEEDEEEDPVDAELVDDEDDEDEDLEPEDDDVEDEDDDEIGDEDADEEEPEEDDDLDDEEEVEDFDDSDEPDDEVSDDDEENEEEEMVAPAKSSSAPKRWTESRLLRLADKDREEFLALAKKYKVFPGRGIKNSTMATRIMEAIDGKPTKTTAAPKKTATAKRSTANRAGAPASKKAATGAKRGPGRPKGSGASPTGPKPARRGRPPAVAASNGHVPKAEARVFIELAESALKIVKELV